MHPRARIVIALDGVVHEECGRSTHSCSRGSVIVRAANVLHSDAYAAPRARYVRIAILDATAAPEVGPSTRKAFSSPTALAIGARLADEALRPDPWSALAAHGLVRELLAEISSDAAAESPCSD